MQIRRIKLLRYRGIEELTWCPGPGLNCLVGPGDVGKSTVLEAIAAALSPAPGRLASEHDYFGGDVSKGFRIDIVLGQLDDEVLKAWPAAPLWTWSKEKRTVQADPDPDGEGVLCVRAQGTSDLEIDHTVIDPSEGEQPLSPTRRQAFGLSTMGSAATAYRELRMSRGSLLSRNVDDDQLRSLVTEAVQATRDKFALSEDVEKRLGVLSDALQEIAPGTGDLALALLSPRGQNLLGMVGLFASRAGTVVPLANSGLGTQQLALFSLARLLVVGSPLFVIDEIESGLEPFRQRDLVARLRETVGSDGQAFLTTHSPAVIGELGTSELYRLTSPLVGENRIAPIPDALDETRLTDPEALLSRLPVLCEGQTEIGLLDVLLGAHARRAGTTVGALGLRLVDGAGQPKVFKVTGALRASGDRFGAFLDSEQLYPGKRGELAADPNVAFGTYTNARCVEEALSKQLSLSELDRLIAHPDADGRDRAAARYQQLNSTFGEQSRKTLVELSATLGEDSCRRLFAKAANAHSWFKNRRDGRALGTFLLEHHPDIQIIGDAEAFWTAAASLIPDRRIANGENQHGSGS